MRAALSPAACTPAILKKKKLPNGRSGKPGRPTGDGEGQTEAEGVPSLFSRAVPAALPPLLPRCFSGWGPQRTPARCEAVRLGDPECSGCKSSWPVSPANLAKKVREHREPSSSNAVSTPRWTIRRTSLPSEARRIVQSTTCSHRASRTKLTSLSCLQPTRSQASRCLPSGSPWQMQFLHAVSVELVLQWAWHHAPLSVQLL